MYLTKFTNHYPRPKPSSLGPIHRTNPRDSSSHPRGPELSSAHPARSLYSAPSLIQGNFVRKRLLGLTLQGELWVSHGGLHRDLWPAWMRQDAAMVRDGMRGRGGDRTPLSTTQPFFMMLVIQYASSGECTTGLWKPTRPIHGYLPW